MKRSTDPWPWLLAAISIATRAPLTPSTLYDFDAAAFAEALRSFEPLRFHPHPPGYTFYVLTTKFIHSLVTDSTAALGLASVCAAAATTCAIYLFGRSLEGRRTGLVAAALYLASPLAWTYGAVQGTYGFGALGATLVGWLAWRRLEGDAIRPAWLGLCAAVAAGFRPDTAVVLSPLLLIACALSPHGAGFRSRLLAVLEAALVGVVGLTSWILPAASASGSLAGYGAAVRRQWEAVGFSNAEDQFSALVFRAVNVAKVSIYGGFALGPIGAFAFLLGLRTVWRHPRMSPASKVTLLAWLAGYAGLSVGIAFGQPGMMLTTLPAACLVAAIALSKLPPTNGVHWAAPAVAVAASALWFLAPPLSPRGFFDSTSGLLTKLSTELLLFTEPGIDLIDDELGGAIHRLAETSPAEETVVLTNVASSTRAMWALPDHHVSCYFAFAGFRSPIPSHDVGEPKGTWSLPPRARWLALLDADRHSISVRDQLSDRIVLPSNPASGATPNPHAVLRVFDLGGAWAIRFREGRIEPVGGSGVREVGAR